MKKKLCLLLLTPIIFSTIGCNGGKGGASGNPKDVDVVIISGQSNGVGCTNSYYLPDTVEDARFDLFFNGFEEIQIAYNCWTKDWPAEGGVTFYSQNMSRKDSFVNVALGQGNSTKTFGPEIGIAEKTYKKYANKLFLIKFACGGSNLKDDWLDRKSPMYPKLMSYVQKQMENLNNNGYNPKLRAFCWMQGEGDSYAGYYQVYQDNLRTFVSNLREDLRDFTDTDELPFIDAGISSASVWEYYREVNAAKLAFSEESENNIFIDTIAAGLHTNKEPTAKPDIYHYDSDSQVLLGNLFAEAFIPFLSK